MFLFRDGLLTLMYNGSFIVLMIIIMYNGYCIVLMIIIRTIKEPLYMMG